MISVQIFVKYLLAQNVRIVKSYKLIYSPKQVVGTYFLLWAKRFGLPKQHSNERNLWDIWETFLSTSKYPVVQEVQSFDLSKIRAKPMNNEEQQKSSHRRYHREAMSKTSPLKPFIKRAYYPYKWYLTKKRKNP